MLAAEHESLSRVGKCVCLYMRKYHQTFSCFQWRERSTGDVLVPGEFLLFFLLVLGGVSRPSAPAGCGEKSLEKWETGYPVGNNGGIFFFSTVAF